MELNRLYIDELEELIKEYGEQSYRATQLFAFLHSQKRGDIENSNLPKSLKTKLQENCTLRKIKILEEFQSQKDETKKLLFELDDLNIVEGVLMKYKHGYSQCISTQVGCRMGCVFCASTKEGLIRNLTASEMLSQIYEVENKYGIIVSNVILMGSGEPLDNYDEVLRFLKILHHEKGKNLSYRNMTISTCGISDKIYELADENLPITLAISLHTTNNISRDSLMPINKRYNLESIIESCKYYSDKTKSRITFEYTLIHGENDLDKNAYELKELLKGLKSHINLIPLNPIEEYSGKKPNQKDIKNFMKKLEALSLNVTIRRELGSDINAACGQLRRDYKRGGSNEFCCSNKSGVC
ncbi:23S rRNA (adenine(2503)-C(2))-methyltransferase RlmN [Anaerosphaera multitolerans]|uniref:Probable dual-specificity RNA methyltransferase RlmN n=1 Tax=Anaerosphaera multitolerans TaxID=2487351 RepID=A0A437S6V0_9FIRM|nr:23S rRNA (adenine(2503)-C(2))-methyltransferase RlmN [Anaerosphaera multitolerans]RVU54760.1 23S rRNA (adenine(2503)-C(2))-methyltransferase RlmN [Anaerosphaera multitolerans]